MKMYGVFGQTLRTVTPRHLAAENRADDAIGIADIELCFDFFLALQRWRRQVEQHLIIERVLQTVVLRNLAVTPDLRSNLWLVENRGIVEPLCLQVFHSTAHLDPVRAARSEERRVGKEWTV